MSMIPTVGPLAAALTAGGLTAGRGLANGQGPLTSLLGGALAGAGQYGFDKLGAKMFGPSNTELTTQRLINQGFNIGNISSPMGIGSTGLMMPPAQFMQNPMFFGSGRFF